MNSDIYIYTAGSLTYMKKIGEYEKALEWRDKLQSWSSDNGVKMFNPAQTFLRENAHNYSYNLIVHQNEFFLKASTIMVVQLDYIDYSPGTIFELAVFRQMGKPVIAFGGTQPHWSPHINSCISQYCKDIDDVIDVLSNMFL
jgi:nucleoside 2-deoxyribosyltransferase